MILKSLATQELKRPTLWLGIGAALLAWPIAVELSPLSTTLGASSAKSLAYNIAYLVAILGALVGASRMDALDWLFSRSTETQRVGAWLAWTTLCSFTPTAISLSPLALLQGVGAALPLASFFLISAHLAATMIFLAALGFSGRERSLLVVLLAIGLQATLAGVTGPATIIARVVDPASGEAPGLLGPTGAGIQVASIYLLISLSALFSSRKRRTI
ncbi:MAG: hypothetical protein MK297_00840 [Planctomycetes bacterium]|nr:hypothetical protein [Planctomycetota bacterium]